MAKKYKKKYKQLKKCYKFLDAHMLDITDDNMLVEAIGVPVLAVLLNDENKKITTPGDLDFAEFVIMKRSKGYV